MIKMISLEWLLYAKAVHLVPSKLSSTVRLLGDELGAEDVHLLVTRVLQFWHEHCRAAAVIDTRPFCASHTLDDSFASHTLAVNP